VRQLSRSVLVALLTAAMIVVCPSTFASRVSLTATALYMGGTDHPLSVPPDSPAYTHSYIDWAYNNFVGPSGLCSGGNPGCSPAAVYTPAQFWPITGLSDMHFDQSVPIGLANLDNCLRGVPCVVTYPPYTATGPLQQLTDTSYTVFSYSQSGTIASIEKSYLIAHPPTPGTVSFVFVSNPNRPNGGILERFVGVHIPILGVTFNGATVTNSPESTPLTTVDVVHQYDPVADFPTNPLNLVSDLNALMGFFYEHPEGQSGTPELQGQYQDSTYYLIPTTTLPLLRPVAALAIIGPLIATILDPRLRVLVESGYDRTINPGASTPAQYLYFPNPVTTAINLLASIPIGWDNGIAYATGDPANRPFRTTEPGPYGVGGPPVYAGAVDPYGPPTPAFASADAAPRSAVTMASATKSVATRAHGTTPRQESRTPLAGSRLSARQSPVPSRLLSEHLGNHAAKRLAVHRDRGE